MLCEFKFLYCIEHSLKPGHLNFNSIKRLLIYVNCLLLNVKYMICFYLNRQYSYILSQKVFTLREKVDLFSVGNV